ncbi:unnamed protein product [Choristocarpus tenellus]
MLKLSDWREETRMLEMEPGGASQAPSSREDVSPDDITQAMEEVCRVAINAITICGRDGSKGLGMYLSAAMFNHSCCPNLQAWWKGAKLEIRCSKAVSPGEELCLSYIPLDQSTPSRQAQLRSNWGFICCCLRCYEGRWDAELEGFRCSQMNCQGAVPVGPCGSEIGGACSACGHPWGSSITNHLLHGRALAEQGEEIPLAGGGIYPSIPITSEDPLQGDWTLASRPRSEDGGLGTNTTLQEHILEQDLIRADREFEEGMRAYMMEEAEVALIHLEQSLTIRESFLHAFNHKLLRTLRANPLRH